MCGKFGTNLLLFSFSLFRGFGISFWLLLLLFVVVVGVVVVCVDTFMHAYLRFYVFSFFFFLFFFGCLDWGSVANLMINMVMYVCTMCLGFLSGLGWIGEGVGGCGSKCREEYIRVVYLVYIVAVHLISSKTR